VTINERPEPGKTLVMERSVSGQETGTTQGKQTRAQTDEQKLNAVPQIKSDLA